MLTIILLIVVILIVLFLIWVNWWQRTRLRARVNALSKAVCNLEKVAIDGQGSVAAKRFCPGDTDPDDIPPPPPGVH
jgi:hypothetical protein